MRRYEGGIRSGDIYVRDKMTGPRRKWAAWGWVGLVCIALAAQAFVLVAQLLARQSEAAYGSVRSAGSSLLQRRAEIRRDVAREEARREQRNIE